AGIHATTNPVPIGARHPDRPRIRSFRTARADPARATGQRHRSHLAPPAPSAPHRPGRRGRPGHHVSGHRGARSQVWHAPGPATAPGGPDLMLRAYLTKAPASTGSVTPVMYRASSRAGPSSALLMSSHSTHGTGSVFSDMKPGMAFSWVGSGSSGANIPQVPGFWIMIVSTLVGWMVFTRMRYGPSSLASVRINPTMPCFAET